MDKRSNITFSTKYTAYATEFIEEADAKNQFLTGYNIKSSEFIENASQTGVVMGKDNKFYCREIYDGNSRAAGSTYLSIVSLNTYNKDGTTTTYSDGTVLRPYHPSGYYDSTYYYYLLVNSSTGSFTLSATPSTILNTTSCKVVGQVNSSTYKVAISFKTVSSQTSGTLTLKNSDGLSATKSVILGTQTYLD